MTEPDQQSNDTNGTPTKKSKSKPISNQIATDLNKPDKPPATRQIQARRRYPPHAPGFVPVPVDIVITMSLQLALTITNFFVILTSFAYTGDDIGWYILFEIIFTYVGFAYFVHKISKQVLVYKKFFRKLNNWHDRKLQQIADGESSCCCLWCILVRVTWWIAALLLFPIIIFWSMYQSFQWYKDKKRVSQSAVDVTQFDNVSGNVTEERKYWKMSDRAYSVWHLGVLSKQASMITMFIQDLPLLIISAMIANYLGIIVYSISIFIKLLFWIKHMIDLGKLTLFYDCLDYLDHFAMSEISWYYSEEFNIDIIVPKFYTQWQHEMSTLQRGDWILVYIGDGDLTQHPELDDTNARIMVIYQSKHFKKTNNLICIDYKAVPAKVFDNYAEGKTKHIEVPSDCVHTFNRWDGNIMLLRDELFEKYHDNGSDDASDSNSNKQEIEKQSHVAATEVTETENNNTEPSNRNVHKSDVSIEIEEKHLENTEENIKSSSDSNDIQQNDTVISVQQDEDADNDKIIEKEQLQESDADDNDDNETNMESEQYEVVVVNDSDEQVVNENKS